MEFALYFVVDQPVNRRAGNVILLVGGVVKHEAAQLFDQNAFCLGGGWNVGETAWNVRQTVCSLHLVDPYG